MKKVMVLVAHPDDEVIGLGGTLAKHALRGDEIVVVILCESTSPRDGKKGMDELKTCALNAGKVLGVKEIRFHEFPNLRTNAISLKGMVSVIREELDTYKPHIIYTHHRGDVNIDHQKVFEATMTSISTLENLFEKILCFQTYSSTEWAPPFLDYLFIPTVFEDISETIQLKLDAMVCYGRELRDFPHPRSLEALRIFAQEEGIRSGLNAYAESFELIKINRE